MDWFQIVMFMVGIYGAYCVGHWVGYGKGEQDKREFTSEIIKLSSKRTLEIKAPFTQSPE